MRTKNLLLKAYVSIFLIALTSATSLIAQNSVSVHLENVPMSEVLDGISEESGFSFFFKEGVVDINEIVSISAKGEELTTVLSTFFKDKNIKYDILKSQIVLSKQSSINKPIAKPPVIEEHQLEITGTVISSDGNYGLPGVSIVVLSSGLGTISDGDGNFSINVEIGEKLRFSYIGYTTQVVTVSQNKLNIVLHPDVTKLDEVIVVGLGISRDKKALGYSIAEVEGQEVNTIPTTDIVNNLSGRVPGLEVSSSSGNMGGSARVLIRGAGSMLGNNQPLYVVDGTIIDNSSLSNTFQNAGLGDVADYGNLSQDINPDDIENVTVLKGPAASAIYGSRAANGVILITTKNSGKSDNVGIDVSFTGMFENVARLPQYQNSYGGGLGTTFEQREINGKTYNIPFYAMDQSWGPKLDGTPVIPYWSLYNWEANGKKGDPETVPWEAQPSNIRDFFETGFLAKTNVAFYKGTDIASFRMSFTNLSQTGVFPNSNLGRNTINFSGNLNLTKKLFVGLKGNFVKNTTRALPVSGYSNNGIMTKLAQWGQRQWDMSKMKDYKQPDGTQRTWNRISFENPGPQYADNPYWTQYENYGKSERNRVFGNTFIGYKLTDWMTAQFTLNIDHYDESRSVRTAEGSTLESYYATDVYGFSEINNEFSVNFQRQLNDDFHVTGMIGANRMDRDFRRVTGSVDGGLAAPGIYSLTNSKNQAFVDEYKYIKRINSAYGSATIGWRSLLYLDGSFRNDWSSTLPADNNSYPYYSTSLSLILSELPGLENISWIDFLKIRGGYAKVGNDTDAYNLESTYISNNSYGSYPLFSNPNAIFNGNLKPETSNSWETGLEMNLFKNRLSADVTYYNTLTIDQIMPIAISATSGFRQRWLNAGSMSNKGVELGLTISPVQTKNFTWNATVNFAKNVNEVVELPPDIDQINLADINGTYLVVAKGEKYGMLKGVDFVYQDGQKVIEDGLYKQSEELKSLGSVMPDYTVGLINDMQYKRMNFGFTIAHQKGGHYQSLTNMYGIASGSFESTAANGIREKGIIIEGVKEDGTPNDVNVDAFDWANAHRNFGALNIFEATYFKLREIHLTYSMPSKYSGPFQGVRLSLVGKNLAMWGTDNPHVDPEQITNGGNIQGFEGGANPPTYSYGFNVSITL
ncbi:SusC/RagA family TonB-linked outer membrane protein [Portibacter lacus]|uniref:SusC/RagA family TonB-linked outer membrane protein n=1 Tax=Portibacter lacus TaxID=1099794 RepID=A0AA37WGJ0_9BACT|nr:SusC/RagA family TonB-linked outer membrane protein [Portibacter lacus]GLR19977.1 SusC/RagA family TonB-linked outer membrane protein [Portibacter lacus]